MTKTFQTVTTISDRVDTLASQITAIEPYSPYPNPFLIPEHAGQTAAHGIEDTQDLLTTSDIGADSRRVDLSVPPWGVSSCVPTTGVLYLGRITPKKNWTVSKLVAAIAGTNVSGSSLVKLGLYLHSGTVSNLVASTGNVQASHFSTLNTEYAVPLTTAYEKHRGYPLDVALLQVGGTPAFYGQVFPFKPTTRGVRIPRMYAPSTPLTDLPASFRRVDLSVAPFILYLGAAR